MVFARILIYICMYVILSSDFKNIGKLVFFIGELKERVY